MQLDELDELDRMLLEDSGGIFEPPEEPRRSTGSTIRALKDADEDFEWYPTTDKIIKIVCNNIAGLSYSDRVKSVMDVGAGDGRVLTAIRDRLKLNQPHDYVKLYAIEKATVHLSAMPKDVTVAGTDFYQQTLVDKNVDCIFCNPPYSEFEEWTLRIIREATTKHVYLVIPRRWRDSAAIKTAIEDRSGKWQPLGEFDFENADREARAKVEIVRVQFGYGKRDAFDSVIEGMLPELDVFDRDDDLKYDDQAENPDGVIESSENIVEALVMAYNAELDQMISNYRAALKIDLRVLTELGICKSGMLDSIRQRVSGLKNKYWRTLFERMDTIVKRLATKQRAAFLNSLKDKVTIDFTEGNAYAILIWVSKWANDYFDEQLIELFKTLSTDSNVVKYKSNHRVWTQANWRYTSDENSASHYKLEYRIVISHGGICTDKYAWRSKERRGLSEMATNLLMDITTVANNLGFPCDDKPGNYDWESNKQNKIMLRNGEVLCAVRAFMNGNMHIHFNQKLMLAINVEAGRLLGWIRNPHEACQEMDIKGKDAERVSELFGSSFRIAPDASMLRLAN